MQKPGTRIHFEGGNNERRIGGNSSVIEHVNERGEATRVMYDLGALFPPEYTGYDAVIPDVRKYISKGSEKPEQSLDAMFISHCHEDHIGGLVHLVKLDYKFPPIYTNRYTRNFIRMALAEWGVSPEMMPEIKEVKAGEKIKISKDVEVEPFTVSHSTVGAMGFHTLTQLNGKDHAGIINPGDYHMGEVPVGNTFSEEEFADLAKRKLITHVMLDSTSTDSSDDYLVTFDDAVKNTVEQINQNSEKQVVSAVISRSTQNLAIDLEAARQLGRTVYLDGHWSRMAFKAMQMSGIDTFDDVVFCSKDVTKANASEYLAKTPQNKRYIVPSGAFAEEKNGRMSGLVKMSKQEKVKTDGKKRIGKGKAPAQNSSGHPNFVIDTYTLILARQRCIEDINGKSVRAMYNRLAMLGATVVENLSSNNTGKYPTALMQRTGHATKSETLKFIQLSNSNNTNKNIYYVPIHGDPKQLMNTSKIIREAGGMPSICHNMDIIEVGNGFVKNVAQNDNEKQKWIGVMEKESENGNPMDCSYVYDEVDSNFIKVRNIAEIKSPRLTASRRDTENQRFKGDNFIEAENPIVEKIRPPKIYPPKSRGGR